MSRARYAMDFNDGLAAQTVVNTDEDACGASTDVLFRQVDVGANMYGDTYCLASNDVGNCDQWRVRINVAEINRDAVNDGYAIRHTTCHEIGHTVGIWHYGNGDPYLASADFNGANNCMRSGIEDGGQAWTRALGSHDRQAINESW